MSEDLQNKSLRELTEIYNREKPADAGAVWRFASKAAAVRRIAAVRGGEDAVTHQKRGRGPDAKHADDQIVRLLVEENPKKVGSKSHARFALYRDGMSVGDFLKAGGRRADLIWDQRKGFVKIEGQNDSA